MPVNKDGRRESAYIGRAEWLSDNDVEVIHEARGSTYAVWKEGHICLLLHFVALNELEEFLKTLRILIKQTSDHFTFYGYEPLAGDSSDTAHLNRLMEELKEQAAGQLV
jgi:hypothetical protein